MTRINLPKKLTIGLALLCVFSANHYQPVQAEFLPHSIENNSPAAQAGTTTFAVIGDYGNASQSEADVAVLVKSWNPDFIVTVGDNNYPNGATSSIDENIGQYYHEYIFPYKGKYGAGADVRRFFPALGNHDWGNNGPKPYYNYFSFYNEKGYYDFTQGSVHFFILDSDPKEPDGTSATSKQAKWLKSGLAASTAPFNIVVLHHAPYSSGDHGSNVYMQWPYKDWGADAVLAGHDHIYERLMVNNLPYFVNGIGGAELYGYGTILPESQVRFNQDFGAMRVEAGSTSIKFQAYTRSGVLIDEYILGNSTPTVTSITRNGSELSNATNVDFVVNFSEAVTGVDVSDFILSTTNPSNASILNISGTGASYVITVDTGSSDSSLRLDLVDNDSIANSSGVPLGNIGIGNGSFTIGESYITDKTSPLVSSIIRGNTNPSNADNVDFIVTFSEAVLGVDATDFSLVSANTNNIASVNTISGAGNVYTISISTGTGDNNIRLDLVDNDSITDPTGNTLGSTGLGNGNFTIGESYSIDKTPPLVTSILRLSPNPSTASNVDFAINFSETVTGVDMSDFTLTTNGTSGATINSFSGVGSSYLITISTGAGNDNIRLDLIDNDSISDPVGNKLGGASIRNGDFNSGETYTINKAAPHVISVTRANASPTNLAIVNFTVVFSEIVTGVDITDFTLKSNVPDGATITSISNLGSAYTVSVETVSDTNDIRLDVIDNDSIINAAAINLGGAGAGNGNFTAGETFTIDKTAPVVTSIIRASQNPSSSFSVEFIVTFSEPVDGVDGSDFELSANNINSASVSAIKSINPFYVITVNSGVGNGNIRLDLLDNDSIHDAAGNLLGGSGSTNGNFVTGETFNVSKVSVNFPAPTIRGAGGFFITNNSTPTFLWSAVKNAQFYEITIALDDSFGQVVTSQIINSLSYNTQPLSDGTYYWHVRAYNPASQPGKFSKTQSFTIDTTPPPAPALLAPADQATSNKKPTFLWEKISAAINYQIEIDNNSDFSSPEYTLFRRETTVRVSSLKTGIYYWRVSAKDGAGNWSAWSAPFTLIIP